MFKGIKNIKFSSIRFKVSLFYAAVLGVILVIYTGILYFGQRYSLYRDLDRELAIKAQEITKAINALFPVLENDQQAFASVAKIVINGEAEYSEQEDLLEEQKNWFQLRQKLNLGRDYILLTSSEGKAIASSFNIDEELRSQLLKGIATLEQKAMSYRNLNFGALRLRLINIPYYYKNKRMYSIQVGSSVKPINRILYSRILFASLIIPIVVALTAFLGGAIAGRILNPVMKLTNTARNITYKDLSARVKVERVDEELRYLVDAFNEMISRLDTSFRHIAEFSSNVAHELKTPLTVIQGESELVLMQKRDSGEYRRVIKVTQEEAKGMFKTVEDLLLLSRLEYQPQAFHFERFDFSVFIREVFAKARKTAERKNISMRLSARSRPVFVSADRPHLKRMFVNLLNNAVKFTPKFGKIDIAVRLVDRKLEVSIKDTGEGIRPEDIDRVFDRFFRGNGGFQAGESGSGLGLSIAQSIARIHRGTICVTSQPQKGSTFTVTLPL